MATFGKTSNAGSDISFGQEVVQGCKYTSPGDCGTITEIAAFIRAHTGTVNAVAKIYADNAGAPGALLAESSAVANIDTTPAWEYFNGNDFPYVAAANTVYWLCIHASANHRMRYEAGAANQVMWNGVATYPVNPEPPTPTYGAYEQSIYATYTPTGAGLSIPVAMHHYSHHIGKIIRG